MPVPARGLEQSVQGQARVPPLVRGSVLRQGWVRQPPVREQGAPPVRGLVLRQAQGPLQPELEQQEQVWARPQAWVQRPGRQPVLPPARQASLGRWPAWLVPLRTPQVRAASVWTTH